MTPGGGGGLSTFLDQFAGRRILVIGDVMLDRFVWGEVGRISPEAPVPVVRVEDETARPGGAANVAANLTALGSGAWLAGVIGRDAAGQQLRSSLETLGIEGRLVEDGGRVTTVKTRVIARGQQVVRVDREENGAVAVDALARLRDETISVLPEMHAVVVSDYDKGVIDPELLQALLPAARSRGIPVVVDPKLTNFSHYQPVTVISPNQSEAARATAMEIRTDDDCLEAARAILERLDTEAVLVTRGERGMLLAERHRPPSFIPAAAREVYDVTGAGDTVVAVLTLALSAEASVEEASRLANYGAGLVVGKVGTARIDLEELRSAVEPG